MASTRDIKRRIKGITSTKQITNAMELVSTAKLRKARERLEKSKPYYTTVYEDIKNLLKISKSKHRYLQEREVKKKLYIVITADRGLAGGYNANIMKLVESEAMSEKDKVILYVIGGKGKEYFSRRGYSIEKSLVGISENPDYTYANDMASEVLQLYGKGEVDQIKLFYTSFEGMLTYKVKSVQLLPLKDLNDNDDENKAVSLVRFEPSAEEVLDYLIPKYIGIVMYGAFVEASASEQGSRRLAMENATDNANDMIDELSMEYNRARQSAITSEISEIVSGAEALR